MTNSEQPDLKRAVELLREQTNLAAQLAGQGLELDTPAVTKPVLEMHNALLMNLSEIVGLLALKIDELENR
jgi:hypothetical protein